MRRLGTIPILASSLLLGCATNVGVMLHGDQSATQLNRGNFRVIKASARGVDAGFAFLGIIPIVSPSISDATDQLFEGVQAEGRAISLANVTQERQNWYLILFSLPRIVVRADVIEFLTEPDTAPK